MKMFVIDDAAKITAVEPDSVTEGQTTFKTDKELATVSSEWPTGRLVEIWNQLPGVPVVRKFTDRNRNRAGPASPRRRGHARGHHGGHWLAGAQRPRLHQRRAQ